MPARRSRRQRALRDGAGHDGQKVGDRLRLSDGALPPEATSPQSAHCLQCRLPPGVDHGDLQSRLSGFLRGQGPLGVLRPEVDLGREVELLLVGDDPQALAAPYNAAWLISGVIATITRFNSQLSPTASQSISCWGRSATLTVQRSEGWLSSGNV